MCKYGYEPVCVCRIRNHRCRVLRCASQSLATSPLSPLSELPRYPDRYPDIKGIRSLAWRRDVWTQPGCFVNCLSRCVPLCLQEKPFYWQRKQDWDGMEGRRCTGTSCSTDDLLCDRFCCRHWWWLMLIPNSTGLLCRWKPCYGRGEMAGWGQSGNG